MTIRLVTYRETILHTVRADIPDGADAETVQEIVTDSGVDSVEYTSESFEVVSNEVDDSH